MQNERSYQKLEEAMQKQRDGEHVTVVLFPLYTLVENVVSLTVAFFLFFSSAWMVSTAMNGSSTRAAEVETSEGIALCRRRRQAKEGGRARTIEANPRTGVALPSIQN